MIDPCPQQVNSEPMRKGWARVVVLCYHDIALPGQVNSWLQVDAVNFERQLCICRKVGVFIRPDDLFDPRRLRFDRINFLLTFDDGMVNNYRLAFPLLKKYAIPALFFISTWHMQYSESFWFERIVELIQRNHLDQVDLRRLGLGIYLFHPQDGAKRWDSIQILLEDIKHLGKGREDEKEALISALLKQQMEAAGIDVQTTANRPLNEQEIREMQASGLCLFGSHGHHHRILTRLHDAELQDELTNSRFILESLLQQRVDTIAYPNGTTDERVRQACRNACYRLGFSVNAGRVNQSTDHLNIPRLLVGGYDSSVRFIWSLVKVVLGIKSVRLRLPAEL